jgi:hypothetical protein
VIPSAVRILVCIEPQDMRRSFDGLALAAQGHLCEDPQSGTLGLIALYTFVLYLLRHEEPLAIPERLLRRR